MPDRSNQRWFVIATLASWNLMSGFGFYAYILDCYGQLVHVLPANVYIFPSVNYPFDHQRRQFKYHTFAGTIDKDVVMGITVVMLCQIVSSILLCFALDEVKFKNIKSWQYIN